MFLFARDDLLLLQVNAYEVIQAHINIGYPHQREPRYEKSAPVGQQQFKAGQDQHEDSDVMRKAVLAGKEIEKLAGDEGFALLTAAYTVLARFAKDFLVGNGPGNACNRDCQYKKVDDLCCQRHVSETARESCLFFKLCPA